MSPRSVSSRLRWFHRGHVQFLVFFRCWISRFFYILTVTKAEFSRIFREWLWAADISYVFLHADNMLLSVPKTIQWCLVFMRWDPYKTRKHFSPAFKTVSRLASVSVNNLNLGPRPGFFLRGPRPGFFLRVVKKSNIKKYIISNSVDSGNLWTTQLLWPVILWPA